VFALWFIAGESLYSRYGYYLIAMGLFQVVVTHDGSTHLWPGEIGLDKFLEPFSASLILITIGLFLKGFFPRKIKGYLSATPNFTTLIGLILSLQSIVSPYYKINLLTAIFAALICFPTIALYLFTAWRSGIKAAFYMFVGWSIMSFGMYYQVLMKFGFFPYIYNVFQLTCLIDFTLLTVSISLRVKEINDKLSKERQEAEFSKSLIIVTESIVHEVKAPFAIVKNVFDELISLDLKNDFALHLINSSKARVEQTKELLDDILSIGNPCLSKSNLCLNSLVRQSIELARVPNTIISGDQFSIIGDQPKTTRAITNLINNAYKHSNSSEPIEIMLENKDRKKLRIKNYGSFLTEKQIKIIFDPFVSKGSTGLGLYITKSIVDAHNWKINCISSQTENSVAMEILFN